MSTSSDILVTARAEFDQLVKDIRPKLHRYCARMTGSVFDAEDVVQDALAKAYYVLPTIEVVDVEAWLMRIVHNRAIDYLREAKSNPIDFVEEYPTQLHLAPELDSEEETKLALSIYLQLTPMQRSCIILKDVIGYSLAEISELLGVSVGAIKAALHRGRDNLHKLANTVEHDMTPPLDRSEYQLLVQYVERFNARDFDGIREMLADDVRLDLVERVKKQGATNVGRYFNNYSTLDNWHSTVGVIDGRLVILVSEPESASIFNYVILLEWAEDRVIHILDYRYVPYVILDADIQLVNDG